MGSLPIAWKQSGQGSIVQIRKLSLACYSGVTLLCQCLKGSPCQKHAQDTGDDQQYDGPRWPDLRIHIHTMEIVQASWHEVAPSVASYKMPFRQFFQLQNLFAVRF